MSAAGVPTLTAVLDPMELGKHLDLFSLPPWNWGELRDLRVQALKASHRNRCTVEIVLRTATGLHSLIGKVYSEDRSDVYQAMKAIARAGFGPEAEFSIPQPLAFLPALNLLLLQKVEGVRAKDIFVGGAESERAAAAERCALWLARFHTVGPPTGPVLDLNQYLLSLEQWSRRIAERYEPAADKAGRLLERLKTAASTLGRGETCAGHGSYTHAQIILANGRTVTFDWDRCDVADPNRDVARFIVALSRLSLRYLGSIRALDPTAEVFLKTYIARSGREARCLPFYKAAMCIKIAKYEIPRPPYPWRKRIIEGMLEEGLRILEEWKQPGEGTE